MTDETYGRERAKHLVAALRALAARIHALQRDDELLAAGPELLKRMGDVRSELFHYEVRCTYDTPEVADSRRIIDQIRREREQTDFETEGDEPWQDSGT